MYAWFEKNRRWCASRFALALSWFIDFLLGCLVVVVECVCLLLRERSVYVGGDAGPGDDFRVLHFRRVGWWARQSSLSCASFSSCS